MRKIDTSNITNTVAFIPKAGFIDHIQLAYQEIVSAILNNFLGGQVFTGNAYVLWGCVNTGSGLNYVISAGAILYNSVVYLVDQTTFTAAGGQVAVGSLVTTQNLINADPTDFTDGTQHNVHNITKIVFASGAAGSGLVDFSALLATGYVIKNDVQAAALPASWIVNFKQDRFTFFSSASTAASVITFDFTNAIVGAVVRIKWAGGAGHTLAVNGSGSQTVIKDSGNLAAVASANNLLYITYLGKNDLGYDEVSYTLKQY